MHSIDAVDFAGHLQFSFESLVEDGGEEGIEFGGGLGLQALQGVHLRLQRVQLGYNPALLGECCDGNWKFADRSQRNSWLRRPCC